MSATKFADACESLCGMTGDGRLSRMTPDDQPRPGAWIVTHLYSVRVRHYDWIGTVHDPNCESDGEISLKCVSLCPEFQTKIT